MRVLSYNVRHAQGVASPPSNPRLARVIRGIGPCVAGLQEVWSVAGFDQPARLAELTGLTAHFDATHRLGFGSTGNLMLADGIVHGTSRLDLGGRRERRGCLFADIEVDGVRFGFGLTHLSLHRATRTRQLVALAERVPAHEPFILVGDFNCSRAELAPLDEVLTFIDTPPRTFPSPYPLRALDHIGYSRHWELRSVRAVPTLASDHLPLVAELVRTGP